MERTKFPGPNWSFRQNQLAEFRLHQLLLHAAPIDEAPLERVSNQQMHEDMMLAWRENVLRKIIIRNHSILHAH